MTVMNASSLTPSAMPAVAPSTGPLASVNTALAGSLTAPVMLVNQTGALELNVGSILIGRSPECEVTIADVLVSRHHARVVVAEDGVWLEDLHSTNGIYVNARAISHRTALCEGDRILIGSSELSIFALRSGAGRDPKALSTLPPRPVSKTSSIPSAALRLSDEKAAERLPQTVRADSLRIIGRVAARLATTGNFAEAERVLSGHLRRILAGAGAGLLVPHELLQLACEHALDLARWTTDGAWLDYVVELHLATGRVMSLPLIAGLELGQRWVSEVNRLLLRYYVQSICSRAGELLPDDRRRLPLLQHLAQ